jgi:hypothetical protein
MTSVLKRDHFSCPSKTLFDLSVRLQMSSLFTEGKIAYIERCKIDLWDVNILKYPYPVRDTWLRMYNADIKVKHNLSYLICL